MNRNTFVSVALLIAFVIYVGYDQLRARRVSRARAAVVTGENLPNARLAVARLEDDDNPTAHRPTDDLVRIFPQGTMHIVGEWTRGKELCTTPACSERVVYMGKRSAHGYTFALFRYVEAR